MNLGSTPVYGTSSCPVGDRGPIVQRALEHPFAVEEAFRAVRAAQLLHVGIGQQRGDIDAAASLVGRAMNADEGRGAIERIAVAQGFRKLLVETYDRADFDKARRFYERNGFRQRGQIADYLPDGSAMIVYAKSIGGSDKDVCVDESKC